MWVWLLCNVKTSLHAPFDVRASFMWYHSTTLHYESAVLMQSITEFLSIFSRLRPIRLLLYKSFLVLSLLTLNALSLAQCHDFTFSAYLMADQSDISSDLGSFLSGTVFFFYLRNTVCSKRDSGSRMPKCLACLPSNSLCAWFNFYCTQLSCTHQLQSCVKCAYSSCG